MSTRKPAPYRAEHVGSLLRPARLLEARSQREAGRIDDDALRETEDDCIREVIRMQEDVGMPAVTDGEFRRFMFHVDFLEKISGLRQRQVAFEDGFSSHDQTGDDFSPMIFETTGPLRHDREIVVEDLTFVAEHTRNTAKVTIPSPTFAYARGGRDAVSAEVYPELDDFFDDLAAVYRKELDSLYEAGARHVQMDETNFAFLCDPKIVDGFRARGDDPDTLHDAFARLINASVRDRPDDLSVSIHLCRGNYRSGWVAQGGYEPVAERMFNEIDVDGFFLEYDDERSGDFQPLRHVPSGKTVVLGLISSKHGNMEDPDAVKRRIDEAARFVPLEQIAVSPQCGFASSTHGNNITPEVQKRKLALVVDVARDVWG